MVQVWDRWEKEEVEGRENEWKFVSDSKGLMIHKRKIGKGIGVRVVGVIPVPIEGKDSLGNR